LIVKPGRAEVMRSALPVFSGVAIGVDSPEEPLSAQLNSSSSVAGRRAAGMPMVPMVLVKTKRLRSASAAASRSP
jgi:hypothetical protein